MTAFERRYGHKICSIIVLFAISWAKIVATFFSIIFLIIVRTSNLFFLSWFAHHHAHKFPFFCLIISFENMNCSVYLRFFTFFSIMYIKQHEEGKMVTNDVTNDTAKMKNENNQIMRKSWYVTCALLAVSSKFVAQINYANPKLTKNYLEFSLLQIILTFQVGNKCFFVVLHLISLRKSGPKN